MFIDGKENSEDNFCLMYLATSSIPGAGRGVFAGLNLTYNQLIEDSPTLVINRNLVEEWSLINYVYASLSEDLVMVVFGSAMIYNHNTEFYKNLRYSFSSKAVSFIKDADTSLSTYQHVSFASSKMIPAGSEIFSSYGDDNWFIDRKIVNEISEIEFKHNINYLEMNGICLTDVYLDDSNIPTAGRGLFARKSFKKGELVTISPVLLLPRHEVALGDQNSVLLNYCITTQSLADIALLPLSLAAMINHKPPNEANIVLDWYGIDKSELNSIDFEILINSPSAPLDLAYIASKDIEIHEELTMSYGNDWIKAWNLFTIDLTRWQQNKDFDRPFFRHPIETAGNLFPKAWNSYQCLGVTCTL